MKRVLLRFTEVHQKEDYKKPRHNLMDPGKYFRTIVRSKNYTIISNENY